MKVVKADYTELFGACCICFGTEAASFGELSWNLVSSFANARAVLWRLKRGHINSARRHGLEAGGGLIWIAVTVGTTLLCVPMMHSQEL